MWRSVGVGGSATADCEADYCDDVFMENPCHSFSSRCFNRDSSDLEAAVPQCSCGLCRFRVLREFEEEDLPPVDVDDLKIPTRKFKKLVKTSQAATRKVLLTLYTADHTLSDDLLPIDRAEVHLTALSAKGISID